MTWRNLLVCCILCLASTPGPATAGVTSKVAKALMSLAARTPAKQGADDVLKAAVGKAVGHTTLKAAGREVGEGAAARLIARSGQPQLGANLLSRYGAKSSQLVGSPQAMTFAKSFGDDFVKPALDFGTAAASRVATSLGKPGLISMVGLSKTAANKFAILSKDLATLSAKQLDPVLKATARHKDKIVEFLWNNRGKTTIVAIAAVIATQPEACAAGTATVLEAGGSATSTVLRASGDAVVKPVSDATAKALIPITSVPSKIAETPSVVGKEFARSTVWPIALAIIAVLVLLYFLCVRFFPPRT